MALNKRTIAHLELHPWSWEEEVSRWLVFQKMGVAILNVLISECGRLVNVILMSFTP